MRYFLLDRITEIHLGETATGLKAISYTESIMHDHFPDFPVLPGAMIIEGLAQLAGFLLEATVNTSDENIKRALLCQVDKMKFRGFSIPGDVLTYKATFMSQLTDAAKIKVEASCNGEQRASGIITFSLMAIDSENVKKQRQDVYKVWTRGLENPPEYR
ncbi:MAG: beta-hydroxyacyl-ACP dehydratase [Bacteriovoracaceae bacterium]|jgi:3-hydroxyacyl-[acyl-carrier-protein] dehydratase|nr:beta-hydroxyacyl-ACP dehydratase [Bacteriovoracaceae bacterium]